MHFVYVLKSLKDQQWYSGCTSNIDGRLEYHNAGHVQSTKSRRPFIVLYREEYSDKYIAFRMERFYKTATGKRKLMEKLQHSGIV